MAIQFEVEEEEKKEQEGQEKKDDLTPTKKKKKHFKEKKSKEQKWASVLFCLSIIAVIYALCYIATGVFTAFPVIFLCAGLLVVILLPTAITLGLIWLSAGYNTFVGSYIALIGNVGDATIAVTDFLYKIFPYAIAVFAVIIIAFLILSIVRFKKQTEKNKEVKHKFVWSIVLTSLFVVATIVDIFVHFV